MLEPGDFLPIVGENNFLVVWRLCLTDWIFKWLKLSPLGHAKFRVKSRGLLFKLGESIASEAEKADPIDRDEVPTVYQLLMKKQGKRIEWTLNEIRAEMASQVFAGKEANSSALSFIFYKRIKNSSLQESVQNELSTDVDKGNPGNLELLSACVTEGLRIRPPVTLTGGQLVPNGVINILGYYIPAGTVVTTQSLSMSWQRPDIFPRYNVFDPAWWLQEDQIAERL